MSCEWRPPNGSQQGSLFPEIILVLEEPLISVLKAILQGCACLPTEALKLANVHQLARRSIRLARVPFEFALEACDLGHGLCEFADRAIDAGSDIDMA